MGKRVGVVVLALALQACAYNKETVPLARSITFLQIANQQRVIAQAIDEAVESLDFKPLSGKSATVELTGVFPHSDRDLLNYVRAQVEGKASRSGIRVQRPGTAGADYRLEVGVSWAGMDTREKVRTDEKRLAGQLGLAVSGVLAGYAVRNSGETGIRYVLPGGKNTQTTGIMIGVPILALGWAAAKPPVITTFTLMGRARVLVNAMPTGGGPSIQAEGSGTSKIVIDEGSSEGFRILGRRVIGN